jgi:hypothetical protein
MQWTGRLTFIGETFSPNKIFLARNKYPTFFCNTRLYKVNIMNWVVFIFQHYTMYVHLNKNVRVWLFNFTGEKGRDGGDRFRFILLFQSYSGWEKFVNYLSNYRTVGLSDCRIIATAPKNNSLLDLCNKYLFNYAMNWSLNFYRGKFFPNKIFFARNKYPTFFCNTQKDYFPTKTST